MGGGILLIIHKGKWTICEEKLVKNILRKKNLSQISKNKMEMGKGHVMKMGHCKVGGGNPW